MNKLHIALAAALALGSQFAAAQTSVAFEGGQSANALALAPVASSADRAAVRAEGNEAARRLNSRSGQQNLTEQIIHQRIASTRSRDAVRAEAVASLRDVQVVEGGLSGGNLVRTPVAVRAPATVAGTTTANVQ